VNVVSFEGSPYKPSITGGVPASRAAIAVEGDTLLHLAVRKNVLKTDLLPLHLRLPFQAKRLIHVGMSVV